MSSTPMFPLESAMLPGEELPLRVFEPRYAALVQDTLDRDDKSFGVVLISRGREVGGGDDRHDIGVRARIAAFEDYGDGTYRLRCPLTERIRVTEWLSDDPYPRAVVQSWPDEPGPVSQSSIVEVEDRIWGLFERIAMARDAHLPDRADVLGTGLDVTAGQRLYELAARMPMGTADKYSVLAAASPADRLTALQEAVDTVTAMVEFQLSGD
ncbi:ATP-dependent protease [Mycobacterium sp. MS1601]|uniref:LON peptidase substrate-binding domain-containing protein n=1 Tax=Mycobacterium sp. MS1601 TaxID=1936029 RepID=UPI00097942B0|nr:LON peptidase substrate-binding domain-containing protein [Mycobacterium sp. MS1601]AQA02060.1 ATP-dependent protease [Mycobacterium sp. MS1601]